VRSVLVSGISRGLGLAIFDRLLYAGTQPIGIGRTFVEEHQKAAREGRCRLVACDLSDFDALNKVRSEDLSPKGTSELVFINNAATIDPIGLIGRLDLYRLYEAMMVNSFAPVVLVNRLLAISCDDVQLKILNISSGAAERAIAGWSSYCVGKAAAQMFFSCLVAEHPSVEVSNIDPGTMDTDMQTSIRASRKSEFPHVERFREMQRSGTLRNPSVVADEIVVRAGLV
jgi:benzil reductase ((S)-benzoin forming)